MQEWIHAIANSEDAEAISRAVEYAARELEFEYCAYGLRMPVPIAEQRTVLRNNYPCGWQKRYSEAQYLNIDPTVAHGYASLEPIIWSDQVFASARVLWDEARSFGLKHGWAQSSLDVHATRGMLSLARGALSLSEAELAAKQFHMSCLAWAAHQAFSRVFTAEVISDGPGTLTKREIEVLRWSADGKTSSEIADIMKISENTVNYHIKRAIANLYVPNRMAAVVRAAMMGLLY